jgi:hypothetical protein
MDLRDLLALALTFIGGILVGIGATLAALLYQLARVKPSKSRARKITIDIDGANWPR